MCKIGANHLGSYFFLNLVGWFAGCALAILSRFTISVFNLLTSPLFPAAEYRRILQTTVGGIRATCWLKKTKDLAQLQALLGHSNIAETMIYVHVDDDMLRGEMRNFDKLIFADIKKAGPNEPAQSINFNQSKPNYEKTL